MESEKITVEGVALSEYLRDKEDIQSETERNELFKDASDTVNLHHKPRRRYKSYTEENGKVKKMSKKEILQQNYSANLAKAIEDSRLDTAIVIILLCHREKSIWNANELYEEMQNFAKEKGTAFKIKKGSFRISLGKIRKTRISEHIEFVYKNNYKQPQRTTYKIYEESKEKLTVSEALDLLTQPCPKKSYANEHLIKTRDDYPQKKKRDNNPVSVLKREKEEYKKKIEEEQQKGKFSEEQVLRLTNEAVEQMKARLMKNNEEVKEKQEQSKKKLEQWLTDRPTTINFTGDIHIHINIEK